MRREDTHRGKGDVKTEVERGTSQNQVSKQLSEARRGMEWILP